MIEYQIINDFLGQYGEEMNIVLMGTHNDLDNVEMYISEKWNGHYWGRICCRQQDKEIEGFRKIEELLYEDVNKIIVFVYEPRLMHKAVSELLDVGISKKNIKPLINEIAAGTPFIEAYDVQLGYTRIFDGDENRAGFKIFRRGDGVNPSLRILSLGGSTTDPLQANMVSWSEYLYLQLSKIFDDVEIICGGIASLTVSQELHKLIRDGLLFEPDIVISYSGVNDGVGMFYDKTYPFIQNYQYALIRSYIEDKTYRDKQENPIYESVHECVRGGVSKVLDQASHWIRCERMMHAVCKEFGIDFIGFLQPQNEKSNLKYVQERQPFYTKAIELVKDLNEEWLIDFTHIFDQYEDIYYDDCHVYERGNRIIVRNMMPYILRTYERRRNKCIY